LQLRQEHEHIPHFAFGTEICRLCMGILGEISLRLFIFSEALVSPVRSFSPLPSSGQRQNIFSPGSIDQPHNFACVFYLIIELHWASNLSTNRIYLSGGRVHSSYG
jgi:hypothetical protein